MRLIEKVWFEGHYAKWLLVPLLFPLTLLFACLTSLRKTLFKIGIKESIQVNCPVIVVGNITVGGNGKTPMVIFLVEQLQKRGVKVGVLSRGYGGKAPHYPYQLTSQSTAEEAGDEPVLIYQRCQVPVVVDANRIAAANRLIASGCQVIISDDGLQHYRLKRNYELAIIDSNRIFGNGLLLPAGPLREFSNRLNSVNRIIYNGHLNNTADVNGQAPKHEMTLSASRVVNLSTGDSVELKEFIQENNKVNAIAGIGNPQRFFTYLAELGFEINKQQGFVDHQAYNESQFQEIDKTDKQTAKPILLMTEKDAVKCKGFAQAHWWYLPVGACFSEQETNTIMDDILTIIPEKT